jgi:hypothetical protein
VFSLKGSVIKQRNVQSKTSSARLTQESRKEEPGHRKLCLCLSHGYKRTSVVGATVYTLGAEVAATSSQQGTLCGIK